MDFNFKTIHDYFKDEKLVTASLKVNAGMMFQFALTLHCKNTLHR